LEIGVGEKFGTKPILLYFQDGNELLKENLTDWE